MCFNTSVPRTLVAVMLALLVVVVAGASEVEFVGLLMMDVEAVLLVDGVWGERGEDKGGGELI